MSGTDELAIKNDHEEFEKLKGFSAISKLSKSSSIKVNSDSVNNNTRTSKDYDVLANQMVKDIGETGKLLANLVLTESDQPKIELNGVNDELDDDSNDVKDEDIELARLLSSEDTNIVSKSVVDYKPKHSNKYVTLSKLNEKLFEPLRNNMAMSFPFELDFFQKQAVMRLERRQHVFVSAHTSAGKTVVAEYAIALAHKNGSRAIYTSPIKALSNQKYRDLREKFGEESVGIITGDTSVNPTANCLIMTTEILRSMLYKGHDCVRDLEYVIFDEVHYVNDAERGVVWEEVIIMLPEKVNLVFLSATTPNTLEFGEWIGRTKNRTIHITGTSTRPVPLQHFIYYRDEVSRLTNGENQYIDGVIGHIAKREKERDKPKPKTAENEAMANQRKEEKLSLASERAGVQLKALPEKSSKKSTSGGGGGYRSGTMSGKMQWVNLVKLLQAGGREEVGGLREVDFGLGYNSKVLSSEAKKLKETMTPYEKLPLEMREKMTKQEYEKEQVRGSEEEEEASDMGLLPAIIFCFSKKKCEEIADHLSQDMINAKEKGIVRTLLQSAFSKLNELDRYLPQVKRLEDMLSRGIGIHHSGLLPILKECVEILFEKSVVKVLIATETFAMGVNMPAKCVVFNGFRKNDGTGFRDLYPGEYTQMAGRAGRRGKDKVGTVIIAAWNDLPGEAQLKELLTGIATKLNSKFRLTYSMLLKLLRSGDLSVEDMIKRSFSEFHTQKALTTGDIDTNLIEWKKAMVDVEDRLIKYLCSHGNIYMDQMVDNTLRCKEVLSKVLTAFKEGLSEYVGPGRMVMYHPSPGSIYYLPQPCYAVILSDPASLSSSSPSATPSVSSATSTITALVSGKSDMKPKEDDISSLHMWVLILLPSDMKPVQVTSETISTNATAAASGSASNKSSVITSAPQPPVGFKIAKRKDEDDDLMYGAKPPKGGKQKGKSGGSGGSNSSNAVSSTASSVKASTIVWKDQSNQVILNSNNSNRSYLITKVPMKDIVLLFNKKVQVPQESTYIEIEKSLIELVSTMNTADVLEIKMKNVDMTVVEYYQDLIKYGKRLLSVPCLTCPSYTQRYSLSYILKHLSDKVSYWEKQKSYEGLSLFPDFQQRLLLMNELGYIESFDNTSASSTSSSSWSSGTKYIVTLKGRVACELTSCDELVSTEMIFDNILDPLNPPEVAALLSALVFEEKVQNDAILTTRLESAKIECQYIVEAIESLSATYGIANTGNVYGKPTGLNFGLAAPIYQWARGVSFKEITDMTDVQEGGIVRTVMRLDECCKDFAKAAVVMGNEKMERKMLAASECIKRDIISVASLYLS